MEVKTSADKLVNVASKVKTPLALSGVVIVVLYLIYKQILSLNIFSNIGADPTFRLLQSILDKLFWLALIAIILGVVSYLITIFLGHKSQQRSSNVILIDASLDPKDSPYEQTIHNGKRKVQPKTNQRNGERK